MADPTPLVEQREAFAAKQKDITEVLELAGKDLDFSRADVLKKLSANDASDATHKFKNWNKEAEAMGQDLQRAELKYTVAKHQEREQAINSPVSVEHPEIGTESKSWAQRFVESKAYKAAKATGFKQAAMVDLDISLKTLMTTSAGFAPESVRSGLVVDKATRPIQVTDLIPTFPINQAAFVYMEETTRTHSAAEAAEAGTYAEDAYVYTQRTSTVRKIATSIPVTDEQLEDEMQVRSLLEQRLAFGLRQRLDGQILVGDGIAPNLLGLNSVSSTQSQAKGSDPTIAAFMKALTKVRVTGRANPSGAVFHPNDWQDVVLTQNSNGDFLFGNPFQGAGPNSLFGIPVAISDAQTENTALIVDFNNFTRLDDRRGVSIMVGYSGTQFVEGKQTLRADMRVAFTCTRAAAICLLTGI
jgi:HK97 family phage major capsid protein